MVQHSNGITLAVINLAAAPGGLAGKTGVTVSCSPPQAWAQVLDSQLDTALELALAALAQTPAATASTIEDRLSTSTPLSPPRP